MILAMAKTTRNICMSKRSARRRPSRTTVPSSVAPRLLPASAVALSSLLAGAVAVDLLLAGPIAIDATVGIGIRGVGAARRRACRRGSTAMRFRRRSCQVYWNEMDSKQFAELHRLEERRVGEEIR